jgi:DNA-binding LacI/PurR family transcriptional regulator
MAERMTHDDELETLEETADETPGSVPTLQTVAEAIGVSRTTVSNAYIHPERLSSTLREEIMESAARLGYHGPNPAARSLRTGRAGTVAGVFGIDLSYAFTDPFAIQFWRGVAEPLEQAGVGLSLLPVAHHAGLAEQALQDAHVDGIILFALRDGDPRLEVAVRRKLPGVVVDGPALPGFSHVGIDEEASTALAARHLLELGHRRIAVLAFPDVPGGAWESTEILDTRDLTLALLRRRIDGALAVIERAGVPRSSVSVRAAATNTVGAGAAATREMLRSSEPPTAILALSDQLARGVVLAARQAGVRVPDELSVTGFDFASVGPTPEFDITTIVQPVEEKGRRAAEAVLAPRGTPPRDVRLETALHLGSTTGRPSLDADRRRRRSPRD